LAGSAWRLDPGECLAFEIEIDRRVHIGGIGTGMAKPLADGGQIDTPAFRRATAGIVAETMGMEPFARKVWHCRFHSLKMLPEQVADAEAGWRLSPMVHKYALIRRQLQLPVPLQNSVHKNTRVPSFLWVLHEIYFQA
jgi:hypothetical protein